MESILRDIRYGVRSLRKSPALTLVAITALTLGIALTTTMFSIMYGALIKGLPFDHGDRIMAVEGTDITNPQNRQSVTIADYLDYRAQQHSFEQLAASTSGTINVSGTEKAERFDGTWITANAFSVTRVRPLLGRTFVDGEDTPSGPKVAIIGYGMWHDRYAADPAILGKTIRADGVPFTIIGVMPKDFLFPDQAKIWLPLQVDPNATKRDQGQGLQVYGRLKDGVSVDQANAEIAAIAQRLAAEYPATNKRVGAAVKSFVESVIGPQPRQLLTTMMGAVFFVLLIACANVANLLLDRAAHKTKEVGIRTALGASRSAVVRQFLTEALTLSAIGAVFGVILAYGGIAEFNRVLTASSTEPFFIDIRMYPAVLAFAVGVAALSTLLCGTIPAYQSSRTDINEVLKDDSRGASSFRIGKISKALVVVEIALSCALLIAAGLMIKSVTKMRTINPGFATKTVFTTRVGFPVTYTDTAAQARFYEALEERVAAIPGVQAAAMSTGLPAAQQGLDGSRFAVDGVAYAKDADYPHLNMAGVSPGFFSTLQIPLVRGRLLTSGDRLTTLPVGVVTESFVRMFSPDKDPIGRRVRLGTSLSTAPWITIVGVVPDVFGGDPQQPKPPVLFRPLSQDHSSFAYISARTDGPPLALAAPIREIVSSLNPDIPIYWPYTLDEAIARPLWFVRVFGTIFMIVGAVALILAAIGLYAVMAFSVSRRRREVGIRMALGAQARNVVGLIVRQGMVQLIVGMLVGLLLAFFISKQGLSVILFDVQAHDPVIFGGVVLVLSVAGLVACLVPASRATRIDPLQALRSE